jgi:hypothetical protein
MVPILGIVLPPHIEVICGLWRSKIDKVGEVSNSSLEAVFRAGGNNLSLDTEVRE